MTIKIIFRLTIFYFLFPGLFIKNNSKWRDFDLEKWSKEEYSWEQDPWNGFLDHAAHPETTIEKGGGDCVDYSLLTASHLKSNGRSFDVVFCWNWHFDMHMVVSTDEKVYSSGIIKNVDIDEYIENSKYACSLSRRV